MSMHESMTGTPQECAVTTTQYLGGAAVSTEVYEGNQLVVDGVAVLGDN